MSAKSPNSDLRRSLWNKWLPVSIRHNIGLILTSISVIVLTGFIVGSYQIRPIVFSNNSALDRNEVRINLSGELEIFDLSVSHQIALEISDLEYQLMIRDFQSEAKKTWIQADATIDGVFIKDVGLRLKGNSTLMGLRASAPGMPEMPTMMAGFLSNASFENPSSLPLLISFNKFVPGRLYQGYSELAVRPSTAGSSSMNEALALQLIADSGQVSQNFSWVEFTVNGSPSATRLVLENPDLQYAYRIEQGRGVLYKSSSENEFTYKGEDLTQYVNDFDQLNAVGSMDMAPVINLLAWLETSSETEFNARLTDWVDIPSFAQYVVTQELFGNFDDMAGPGRNFMLWYSLETHKFTVINWDMNLALMGNMMAGMMPPAGARMMPTGGMIPPGGTGGAPPDGMMPPFDMNNISAFPGMRILIGNQLKDRFIASEAFADEIAIQRDTLSDQWNAEYASTLIDRLQPAIADSDTLSKVQIADDIVRLKQVVSSMLR